MKPILFDIPLPGWPLSVPTYGVLLAAAFLAALGYAQKRTRRAGLPPDAVLDLWIAALISGILGAKILLYVIDFDYYLRNPSAILGGWRSAGVFYGGFAAAVVTCAVMVARRGLPVWKIADISAPAIALGQAIGRVGCFCAGCCYGKPSDLPWAVTFTDPAANRLTGVPLNVPLHPSQLYLSAADIALFAILILLQRRPRYDGQVFLWYVVLHALLRGALEFTRGDPRGALWGLSTSQIIAIAALLAGAVLLRARRLASARAGSG